MTDSAQTAQEHLAFLRQLAHAGKEAPLTAGPYLIAGGCWSCCRSLMPKSGSA